MIVVEVLMLLLVVALLGLLGLGIYVEELLFRLRCSREVNVLLNEIIRQQRAEAEHRHTSSAAHEAKS